MKKFLPVLSLLMFLQCVCEAREYTGIDENKFKVTREQNNASVNKAEFDTDEYYKQYKKVTKDGVVMQALELMKSVNIGKYSYNAIMGNNVTEAPIKIEFKNLAEIDPKFENFEALGWKKKGKLTIYLNAKHRNAPPEAIAAVLAHEAIHQDELSSLNEETYCWCLEAGVWMKLAEKNPSVLNSAAPLVRRENNLKKLYEKGDYTNKYIKRAVFTNPGYQNLPTRSPGFEDDDL